MKFIIMEQQEKKKDKDNNKLYLIIITILTVLCLLLTWQFFEQKKRAEQEIVIKEQVIVERDNIKSELVELKGDYESLQTSDKKLQAEFDERKLQIEKLIKEAEKHKDDAYIISKLRKEADTLRKIMKGYIVTLDSLNTLNKNLIVEKDKVKSDLSAEKDKTNQLIKEKEDLQTVVAKGSQLKATATIVKAVRFKSGGKKEIETTKASKAEKIKVTFSLAENSMAKSGNKIVYLRIITPDGKEMAMSMDSEYKFKFGNSRGYYAGKQEFNYSGTEMGINMYGQGADKFVPGKYIIEVYNDESLIGDASIILE